MQIDVFFGTAGITPADVSGRAVAVIDVLRASTSIAVALDNGARAIVPVALATDAAAPASSGRKVRSSAGIRSTPARFNPSTMRTTPPAWRRNGR